MRGRVEECWCSVRSLTNAPVRRLDHSSEAFRSVLLHHSAQAVVLQECYRQLKYLNEMSARRCVRDDVVAGRGGNRRPSRDGLPPGEADRATSGPWLLLALNPAGKLVVTGAGALTA
jgi:hypothetical protein